MSRRAGRAVAIALLSLIAACGDGGDDVGGENPSTQPTSTARSVVTTAPSESTLLANDDGVEVFTVDEAIRFEVGGTSTIVSGAVVRSERDRYTLGAAAGQTMILTLVSPEDNAVVDVFGPSGELLANEVTATSIELPSEGVYTLIVGGTRGNATYDLTVEIPA